MLSASLKDKEVILDDLDVSALLGQWQPLARAGGGVGGGLAPRLVYERRSEAGTPVEVTAIAIMKNESRIVCRMLQSTIPWCQACIILDTGSGDNTLDCIKRFMECHDWSGKLYSCPMTVDQFEFDTARNMLLGLAACYGKWLLLTDADYIWEFDGPQFYHDGDEVDAWLVGTSDDEHFRPHLVRSQVKFQYVRKAHEHTDWHQAKVRTAETQRLVLHDIGDGGAKKNKYLRDALLLKRDPEDARFYFYYGCTLQSLADVEQNEHRIPLAMDALTKRIHYGGEHWPQEVYLSRMRRCQMMANKLAYPVPVWLQEGLEAFLYCPIRLEALQFVVLRLLQMNEYVLASSLGSLAYLNGRPRGSRVLFVSKGVHECSFWTTLCCAMQRCGLEEYFAAGFLSLRQRMIQGKIDRTDVLHDFLREMKLFPDKNRALTQSILVDGGIEKLDVPDVCRFQDAKPFGASGGTGKDPKEAIDAKLLLARSCKAASAESKKLDWLGHLVDAVKLSIGYAHIPRSLTAVTQLLRMSPYENLIGLVFRIAFPN